jgi:nucleoside-diphosphate-sugar epimerase
MAGMILVTGGAGFIGSFACERLLAEGYEVRTLTRGDYRRPAGEAFTRWPQAGEGKLPE